MHAGAPLICNRVAVESVEVSCYGNIIYRSSMTSCPNWMQRLVVWQVLNYIESGLLFVYRTWDEGSRSSTGGSKYPCTHMYSSTFIIIFNIFMARLEDSYNIRKGNVKQI